MIKIFNILIIGLLVSTSIMAVTLEKNNTVMIGDITVKVEVEENLDLESLSSSGSDSIHTITITDQDGFIYTSK